MRENKYTGTQKERRNRTLMRSLSKQGSRSITDTRDKTCATNKYFYFFIYFKYFYLSYIS